MLFWLDYSCKYVLRSPKSMILSMSKHQNKSKCEKLLFSCSELHFVYWNGILLANVEWKNAFSINDYIKPFNKLFIYKEQTLSQSFLHFCLLCKYLIIIQNSFESFITGLYTVYHKTLFNFLSCCLKMIFSEIHKLIFNFCKYK